MIIKIIRHKYVGDYTVLVEYVDTCVPRKGEMVIVSGERYTCNSVSYHYGDGSAVPYAKVRVS